MRWLAQLSDRTHPLALPGIWAMFSLAYFAGVFSLSSGDPCCWENERHLWGAILVYSITPAYLLAGVTYLGRSDRDALRALQPVLHSGLDGGMAIEPPLGVQSTGIVLGVLFALMQFSSVLPVVFELDNP